MQVVYRLQTHATFKALILMAGAMAMITVVVAVLLNLQTDSRLAKFEQELSLKYQQAEAGNLEQRANLIEVRKIAEKNSGATPIFLKTIASAVVSLSCQDNKNKTISYTASGTFFDSSGLIITNQHVLISDDGTVIKKCLVGFGEDLAKPPVMEYTADVVATHKKNDLAILQIKSSAVTKNLPKFDAVDIFVATKAAADLGLGDQIYIGGYPGIGSETFTLTGGVVAGRVGTNFIKTSALIDTGSSGGGVFNNNGQFVGVATAAAKGEIGGSLGYLIDGGVVERFIGEFKVKP